MSDRDPYEVLGLSRDADETAIKKAFRKLGAKHHPDRNPDDPKATDRFKEINTAYQLLSDPEKRAQFDQWGRSGPQVQGFGGQGFGGFGGMPVDIQEQINDFFRTGHRRQQARGRDIQSLLELDFADAVYGCEKKIRLSLPSICDPCKGTGAKDAQMSRCDTCKGSGMHTMRKGTVTFSSNCPTCGGRGDRIKSPCLSCNGSGQTMCDREFDIQIPPGTSTGQRVRLSQMGEAIVNGIPGDLYLVVQVQEDEHFAVSGDNLLTNEFLTFPQITLGTSRDIKLPDGSTVTMTVPPGTDPGTRIQLNGKGVPPNGSLFVMVHTKTPKNLSDRAKELIKELSGELT